MQKDNESFCVIYVLLKGVFFINFLLIFQLCVQIPASELITNTSAQDGYVLMTDSSGLQSISN